ncbi:MAG: ATP-binding protein, partial [Pseudomonadota bacterium]|nr:ATP-binding protein [Pseudomonadota bacterium]
ACTGQFSHPARKGGIDLQRNLPICLTPIRADELALKQILLKLILNAVKFSEKKSRVCLSASHEQGKTILRVEEDRNGIAAGKLLTIIEPFAQSHSNPHVEEDGSCLGLSIVKCWSRCTTATSIFGVPKVKGRRSARRYRSSG